MIAVEPAASPCSRRPEGPTRSRASAPASCRPSSTPAVIDEIIQVTNDDAFEYAGAPPGRGLLVGISSGAAIWAALEVARRPENDGS